MAKFVERVWACDTITGTRLQIIPAPSFTYERVVNDGATGRMSLNVNSPAAKKMDLRSLLRETKATLVLESDNRVNYAGVITNTDYDRDTGNLSVDTADLWYVMEARKAIKHGPADAMTAHLAYTGLSLGTIAKRLFQEAVAPGSQYALPLVLPADVTGSEARTYYGYQLQDIAAALRELTEADGGPDIDMNPRWAASGNLEWAPRIGNLTTGKAWDWNLDANSSGLSGVGVKTDASQITTNSYVVGEGSEKKTLYRSNPSPDQSYPALERNTSYKNVTSLGVLGSLAVDNTRKLKGPTKQWRMAVNKDGLGKPGMPTVNDLNLGDTCRVYTAGDSWLASGWSDNWLIKYSGGLGDESVTLEFQPIGA